jgi:hypothetical protein
MSNRNDEPMGFVGLILGLVLFALVAFAIYQAYIDCSAKGGVLVEGVLKYECVTKTVGK